MTDTKLDGNAYVFSYETIGRARPWRAGTLKALRYAGLRLRSNAKTLGMRWLSDRAGDVVLRTTFGRRLKR
ncbi:hypothetical protein [Vitiosangium sp. GDMCC 1.1324]|uniref:hypothetical protein n=1 Tax=Vitiosangium sp. (strain GDMCC 1.1324) TaxID=2138576 RepID=UPI0011B4ADF3|nr:hypothetical protein [Vitiosangium sp. GDMCC 1.1324]